MYAKTYRDSVRPVAIVDIVKTEEIFPEVHKRDEIENLSSCHLAKGIKSAWISEIIR